MSYRFPAAALGLVSWLVLGAGLGLGPVGCGSSTTTESVPPLTGIAVRAETLTAGRGCGRGATQVFKYAVAVRGKFGNPDQVLASSVYDCFADGSFIDLPAAAPGTTSEYDLTVHVYNEAAYRAAGGDAAVRAAVESAAPPTTNPTWTTTCGAIQIQFVQALAVCQPLAVGAGGTTPAPAAVVLATSTFPGGEAGTLTCEVDYVTVRYRYSVAGAAPSAVVETPCVRLGAQGAEPVTISISPAVAPASYAFEVALLRGDGSVAGLATCTGATSPGLTSSAVCQPAR